MSAKTDQTMRRLVSSIRDADRSKTSAYDTSATVRRVEDGVAWVHIPGGVDETPAKLTIAAEAGDTVQVRVAGGRAFLVGNASAPPTDDTTANTAIRQIGIMDKAVKVIRGIAEAAGEAARSALKIAGDTNQYFWHTESGTDTGAHITEIPQDEFLADPANGGGNLLARSNGIAVRDGLDELATFQSTGLDVYGDDLNGHYTSLVHLGIGLGNGNSGQIMAPYATIGSRMNPTLFGAFSMAAGDTVDAIGWASVAEGFSSSAYGRASHAGGWYSEARGDYSFAHGQCLMAEEDCQFVVGHYNDLSVDADDLFIVGNGGGEYSRSHAFVVYEDGRGEFAGTIDAAHGTPSVTITATTGTVGNVWCTTFGKVVTLTFQFTNSASVASGSNVFVGTLSEYLPRSNVMGASYNGSHALIGQLTSSGAITIRNASPSAMTSSGTMVISFTYVM